MRFSTDTAWTVNLIAASANADTAYVLQDELQCYNYVAVGIWDNEALLGPPLQQVPAQRFGPNCFDVPGGPLVLPPGAVRYFIPLHEAQIDPARLRRVVRGNDAWAAVMLRRDTGDSVFKAKLPRFR